jgi:serine protease AprX
VQPCPLCGQPVAPQVLAKSSELRPPLLPLIQRSEPTWQPHQGICPACALRYTQRFAAERSHYSLHTTTQPHTTFPYYHPAEETLLSQPDRLPDYATVRGEGITIAFLDSGYYPHPDLSAATTWPPLESAWSKLSSDQLRAVIEQAELRLVDYVDLADGGERCGLHQPSLWDGAGNSWHGQMTTTLVAGNGLLSGGYFRGYAPAARILPIKIGRSTGRIPEEDILAGLQWLLRDDHWLRYGVRVVNVAVGGDFLQPWSQNPVCLAAEELSARGVLICAAAGNSGREELVAPAQAPSVLTVGGVEDHNRRWDRQSPADLAQLELYHHSYGQVTQAGQRIRKPEILALGRWLPAPILPPSPVFAEGFTLGELRRVLHASEPPWRYETDQVDAWMFEVWEVVRKRMNAHKWVHPYYQHVDGTSVAVTQVTAVAAQMFAANPHLSAVAAKTLLMATALPLTDKPPKRTGSGLLQPSRAVAVALRAAGGRLRRYPVSGTVLTPGELQKWLNQGTLAHADLVGPSGGNGTQPVYVGIDALHAHAVSVIGSFNQWRPGALPLRHTDVGWWHGVIQLPPGPHHYRFWLEMDHPAAADWLPDPENPRRGESGYQQDHSLLMGP